MAGGLCRRRVCGANHPDHPACGRPLLQYRGKCYGSTRIPHNLHMCGSHVKHVLPRELRKGRSGSDDLRPKLHSGNLSRDVSILPVCFMLEYWSIRPSNQRLPDAVGELRRGDRHGAFLRKFLQHRIQHYVRRLLGNPNRSCFIRQCCAQLRRHRRRTARVAGVVLLRVQTVVVWSSTMAANRPRGERRKCRRVLWWGISRHCGYQQRSMCGRYAFCRMERPCERQRRDGLLSKHDGRNCRRHGQRA